ncbi:L-2-hydroxyglutarate oxidase [Geobacter sp. SVR]|uniref:L-2-hydroxyglutarate oxidase n=1 Tax=Geobacter sp. SVR TaxID=2495594 RepID=UPI00143EFC61|nr:L-2-hydroxyglutarate oxidase [Geobacter sp. SVR]BCS53973.1 hydroxyglutarate oxidase [Geobacter sp. SVR]GCF86246.1 hydroxyglutarate oxidase [Geobacter sp. SVR]
MRTTDIVVVGGGVVGTATAMALLERHPGLEVAVVEKEACLASHQSGHNSGVIHSGLYYRPGSLKARTCISGRDALYSFCAEHNIAHERCGKVVVATDESELAALDALEQRGRDNGLEGLERLDSRGLRHYEPHVAGIAGLFVPQTGIVDYPLVTEAYADVIRSRGGRVHTHCAVAQVDRQGEGFVLGTSRGELVCRYLINCAGLHSDILARLCGVETDVRIVPFRGEYYVIQAARRMLVRNLIYPVPDPAFPFLGVHFTRMINGEVEAGPNAVLALKREGYSRLSFSLRDTLDMVRFPGFRKLVRRYWRMGVQEYRRSFSRRIFVNDLMRLVPEVGPADIRRGGAGVRAQAVDRDGRLLDDFHIASGAGMIHVLNAPSPAATASISIGRTIADHAAENFAL